MLDQNFVILAVLINAIGGLNYLIATLKGRVKPNRVSWFLWAVAPLIAFTAEIEQGVGIQSLMTFTVGFNPLLIFLASFVNKKAEWKIRRIDIACGIASMLGLVLWYTTKVGDIAIIFSIMADGLASIPTVIKSYYHPETEKYLVFLCGGISAAITLLTVSTWNLANYGFPLYILVINTIIVFIIKFQPRTNLSN